jgi:hypothetical protein
MKFKPAVASAVAALLLAGCASTSIGLNNANSPGVRVGVPAPGSFYNAASVKAELSPNGYFGLFFLGYVAAGAQDSYVYRSDGRARRNPPPLAEDRTVTERDCTQPMVQPSANLRCK